MFILARLSICLQTILAHCFQFLRIITQPSIRFSVQSTSSYEKNFLEWAGTLTARGSPSFQKISSVIKRSHRHTPVRTDVRLRKLEGNTVWNLRNSAIETVTWNPFLTRQSAASFARVNKEFWYDVNTRILNWIYYHMKESAEIGRASCRERV